jgi:hypothetical protein
MYKGYPFTLNKIKNARHFHLRGFTPHQIGAGFTMMEIIVSVVLLALVSVGLINIFLSGGTRITGARTKMTGGELGKVFLESLQMDVTLRERSSGAQNGWGQANNCLTNPTTGCPGYQDIDGIRYTPSYNIDNVALSNCGEPGGDCLKRVRLVVQW